MKRKMYERYTKPYICARLLIEGLEEGDDDKIRRALSGELYPVKSENNQWVLVGKYPNAPFVVDEHSLTGALAFAKGFPTKEAATSFADNLPFEAVPRKRADRAFSFYEECP